MHSHSLAILVRKDWVVSERIELDMVDFERVPFVGSIELEGDGFVKVRLPSGPMHGPLSLFGSALQKAVSVSRPLLFSNETIGWTQ